MTEHHNTPGIASAATSIVIGQVASVTKSIRVGAGGIMLPSHRPLVIAEQFGTLATLFQNRIDLGLGRAAGSHMATAKALRRHLVSEDSFSQDVCELADYLWNREDQALVRTIPGNGTKVPNLYIAKISIVKIIRFFKSPDWAIELILNYLLIIFMLEPDFSNLAFAELDK